MNCTVTIRQYKNGFHKIDVFDTVVEALDNELFNEYMKETYGASLFDGYQGENHVADFYDTPDDKIYCVLVEAK